ETAYKEFNITVEVIKGKQLDFPRIETPKSWITIGLDQDLNKAWDQAKAQTIKLLAEQRKISPEQAATLLAQISDCRVSQVVDIKKGIHCLSPKSQSGREDMERPTKETAKYFVSHAKDADFNKAMDTASMGMIKWLESAKKIARLDAYGLASMAMDCRVGTVSDAEKNVHCLLPKSIFVAKRGRRRSVNPDAGARGAGHARLPRSRRSARCPVRGAGRGRANSAHRRHDQRSCESCAGSRGRACAGRVDHPSAGRSG